MFLFAGYLVLHGCGSSHDPCEDALRPYSASTLIGDLYDDCFPRCDECARSTIDALLYLDTSTLPANNAGIPKLILSSVPTNPRSREDRLEFFYAETLPTTIDPGIRDQIGWKVHVSEAGIEYCDECFTNCGLVPRLSLRGSLDSTSFIHDPSDTMAIYLQRNVEP